MFAVDHAATALLIKRRFPSVSLVALLLSVQAMELAWVGLNYLGVERTTTEATVRSVADIHLAYMPYSHSVATAAVGALLAWLVVEKGLGRPLVARAIGLGIFSHLLLDLITHARDIVLWPGSSLALGLGLYDRAPMWGFALEIAYGVVCWRVYRGSRSLLAMIVLGNLANVTLFSAALPGPEQYLAGHPQMLVTLIAVQIVVTLVLINVLATRRAPDVITVGATRQPQMSRASEATTMCASLRRVTPSALLHEARGRCAAYSSRAYSARASLRTGMSGSACFHSVKRSM